MHYTLLLSLVLILFAVTLRAKKSKTVLAFGGNGFIGSELISRMIERKYDITIVSRGNWFFDSKDRIKPFVKHIVCDREDTILPCAALFSFVFNIDHIDYVLDFSGYRQFEVMETVNLVKEKADVYVFISTDSVYDVCKPNGNNLPSREEDAVRPDNEDERLHLNSLDSYADQKLGCEEFIMQQRDRDGLRYLIFRLPDVFGPRDTTGRWWMYQMWMEFYRAINVPLYIPPRVISHATSLVYVQDVARAILLALDKGPLFWDNIYNVGFDRNFTLEQVLKDMSKALGIDVEYDYSDDELSFHHFPTVERGPISISKARQLLSFKPTEWEVALKETVEFNKKSFHLHPAERDDIVEELAREVVEVEQEGEFLEAIRIAASTSKVYSVKVEL